LKLSAERPNKESEMKNFQVQAKNGRGEWELVCTEPIQAAAQATAAYVARRYEVETRVVSG